MAVVRRVGIMFSGGTDSAYAVLSQLPKYDEVHLVSFIRTGLRKIDNPDGMVRRFRDTFPGKLITYEQYDCEAIYTALTPHEEKRQAQERVLNGGIEPLWEHPHGVGGTREQYDADKVTLFMANECLQCKIAMHIAALKWCREHDIDQLCDGGNIEQLDDASQLEDVKKIAQALFARNGVNYYSPVLHVSEDERCRALFEAGITEHRTHKKLEKNHKIPSNQIQCTVPASVLWTMCVFPWLVYDAQSCSEYVDMCCNYYGHEMEKWLEAVALDAWQLPKLREI